jgi:hypothetical protein
MIKGSCSCGGVTVEITGQPVAVRQCWCRQCQQLAGGGATNNAIFRSDDVAISGAMERGEWLAGSGKVLYNWRCSTCGNPVYAQSEARPHLKTVRIGILNPGHGLAPDMVIWTSDAPPWAVFDPALPREERQPAPPPKPA